MSFEKSRMKLHEKIDMHAKFHRAAIENMADAAKQQIALQAHFFNLSAAQIRRFENQRKFNGGSK